jgi:hypothetical protein
MADEAIVTQWLKTEFLNHWKRMLQINRRFIRHESLSEKERSLIFPFIPIRADGYSLRNFLAFILKYIFVKDCDSFIVIIRGSKNTVLWAAAQKIESNSLTELIELAEFAEVLNTCLSITDRENCLEFLQETMETLELSINLGFYLLLDIQVIAKFKDIQNNHTGLLDFYSQVWDLMAQHFADKKLEIYPEPILFRFFRRLTTKTFLLNVNEFSKIFSFLLPKQNLIVNFLDDDCLSSLIVSTQKDSLLFQFPDYNLIQSNLSRYKHGHENDLETLNKTILATIPLEAQPHKINPSASITVTEDFWLTLQKILTETNLESAITHLFEMITDIEEQWSIEPKILLFKRWGKSFMEFNITQLIPTEPMHILKSLHRFQYEALTRIFLYIVDDSLVLISILGIEYEYGTFRKLYLVSDPSLYELYNSEPDKVVGIKKSHFHLAEHGTWVNQLIAITVQDLNQLITFIPLLTNVKGSLKYLGIIENIITYRMYFYPPNFLADLIRRKGATHFLKNLFFPMILAKRD